jgi:sortase A
MIRRPPRLAIAAAAGALMLSACGGGSKAATTAAVENPALSGTPTTFPPATTAPLPTVVTTTIPPVATTATVATTAAPVLPKPIAPPPENATEPVTRIGGIAIPKLGLSTDLYEGITLPTFDHGPGHWPGTAMPGDVGNVVVGGHRVSHSKPFRYLDKLSPGDDVVFTVDGTPYTYSVTGTEIVMPDAIRIVDQTPDKTATLFACNPPGSTAQRIVVHLAFKG